MFLGIIVFIIALVLATNAAYFSIMGLIALFPAIVYPAIVMGASIEAGKVISISWLYRNWDTCSRVLKYSLFGFTFAVTIFTSAGIYGYLSKSHLTTSASIIGVDDQVAAIDDKIVSEREKVNNAKTVLAQLDNAVSQLTEANRLRGQNGAIALRNSQKAERANIQKEIDESNLEIQKLTKQKNELVTQIKNVEAETGPIVYIARLFTDGSADNIEKTVRYLIVFIVCIFDPFAIMLMLAANHSFAKHSKKKIIKQEIIEEVITVEPIKQKKRINKKKPVAKDIIKEEIQEPSQKIVEKELDTVELDSVKSDTVVEQSLSIEIPKIKDEPITDEEVKTNQKPIPRGWLSARK